MNTKNRTIIYSAILFFLFQTFPIPAQISYDSSIMKSERLLNEFYAKRDVTILVTDSGLGGVSVLAGLENRLKSAKIFSNINLIFVNALPSTKFSYNSFKTMEEKALVFNSVLTQIDSRFNADIILIACNTLSVVYPSTQFSKDGQVPVVGIVESGIELFKERIKSQNNKIVLLGTETTIASNLHRSKLIDMGIISEQVITLACPNLESEIQSDPKSEMVSSMIDYYSDEIANKVTENSDKIYVGLCCSHYGYANSIFKKVLSSKFGKDVEILNPNEPMIDLIVKKEYSNRVEKTSIKTTVISQAEISLEERKGIVEIIKEESERVAQALNNYSLIKDLFIVNHQGNNQ